MVSYTPRPLDPEGKSPVRAEWGAGPTAGMYTVENKYSLSYFELESSSIQTAFRVFNIPEVQPTKPSTLTS